MMAKGQLTCEAAMQSIGVAEELRWIVATLFTQWKALMDYDDSDSPFGSVLSLMLARLLSADVAQLTEAVQSAAAAALEALLWLWSAAKQRSTPKRLWE